MAMHRCSVGQANGSKAGQDIGPALALTLETTKSSKMIILTLVYIVLHNEFEYTQLAQLSSLIPAQSEASLQLSMLSTKINLLSTSVLQ